MECTLSRLVNYRKTREKCDINMLESWAVFSEVAPQTGETR